MSYKVEFTSAAAKQIRKLQRPVREVRNMHSLSGDVMFNIVV